MAFKVINSFKDRLDGHHYYKEGKPYPRQGYKPTKKRFEELSKKHPEYKVAFIEETKEEKKAEKKK